METTTTENAEPRMVLRRMSLLQDNATYSAYINAVKIAAEQGRDRGEVLDELLALAKSLPDHLEYIRTPLVRAYTRAVKCWAGGLVPAKGRWI